MEYVITVVNGNNRRVISRHDNIDDAMKAGKQAFYNSQRGEVVSCIIGQINDNGKITGSYKLLESWF